MSTPVTQMTLTTFSERLLLARTRAGLLAQEVALASALGVDVMDLLGSDEDFAVTGPVAS